MYHRQVKICLFNSPNCIVLINNSTKRALLPQNLFLRRVGKLILINQINPILRHTVIFWSAFVWNSCVSEKSGKTGSPSPSISQISMLPALFSDIWIVAYYGQPEHVVTFALFSLPPPTTLSIQRSQRTAHRF